MAIIEFPKKMLKVKPTGEKPSHGTRIPEFRKCQNLRLIQTFHPSPCGPPPAVEESGRIVCSIAHAVHERVVARDVHHARLVAVTLKENGAVVEKGGLWQNVILQDDSLLDILEEPMDGACDILVATKVLVEKPRVYFARPVHVCNHFSRLTASLGIIRM